MNCWRVFVALGALTLGALLASPVRADSSVVVLGVRALDGEDEKAREVSVALREGAKQVPSWKVSDRDISLAQMSLAHACDEPDARCMADIAGTLEVDRLVYGTMLRRGPQIEIALFNFDAITGQVESTITDQVTPDRLEGFALKATMTGFAKRLGGIEAVGALRIISNAPGARVYVDDKQVGVLDARAELLVAGVAVGHRNIVISDPTRRGQSSVAVFEAETSTVRLPLSSAPSVATADAAQAAPEDDAREHPRNLRRILGWSAVGLAGAMTIATAYTWIRIDFINDDSDLTKYRNLYPKPSDGGPADACALARDGLKEMESPAFADLERSAVDLCSEADTLVVLQYVFLGSAIVAGGVGAYLLLTDKKPERAGSVALRPHLSRSVSGLSASLRF